MLDLNKTEPQFFIDYKSNDKNYKKNPNNYLKCGFAIKQKLRQSILEEQKGQCFYCEKKIENNTEKIHIDHIKQRACFHNLECEYKNMVVSCNGNGGNHCGKYKDNQEKWDDAKFIKLIPENSQLSEKPSAFFKYVGNGKIKPKKNLTDDKKERAENTIKYLNLNFPGLVNARKIILYQIDIYKQQGFNIKTILALYCEFESVFK